VPSGHSSTPAAVTNCPVHASPSHRSSSVVQRVHTSGGVKPTTACQEGDKAFVPYAADYYFYEPRESR